MAKLAKSVFVRDAAHSRTVLLRAGEEPEPSLASLVTNPDAWENGQAPSEPEAPRDGDAAGKDADTQPAEPDNSEGDKPAAKKQAARKTAARKPAAN